MVRISRRKAGNIRKMKNSGAYYLHWFILVDVLESGTETGRSWNEEYEVTGTIGRSSGNIKIPLLIKNSRSYGGGSLLDDCIIRIDDIHQKRTLYKTENFHVEDMKVYECFGDENYKYRVAKLSEDSGEWEVQANFKTEKQAHNWVAFMRGKRYRT